MKLPRVSICSDCGVGITHLNKTGRCRSCGNKHRAKDPAFREKQASGIRKKWATDPEFRARKARITARTNQKRAIDPEFREWLIEHGRRLYREVLSRPDMKAKCAAAKVGLRKPCTLWCPDDLYPEYQRLMRSKRMCAADARKAIEKMMAEREAWSADIEDAIYFLRRRFSISRADNRFRVGTAVLTRAELIEKARVFGWREAA